MHLTIIIKSPLFLLLPTGFVLVLLDAFPSIHSWLLADFTLLIDSIVRLGVEFGLHIIGVACALDIAFLDEYDDQSLSFHLTT